MANYGLWEVFSSGLKDLLYKEVELVLGRMVQSFLLSWTFPVDSFGYLEKLESVLQH